MLAQMRFGTLSDILWQLSRWDTSYSPSPPQNSVAGPVMPFYQLKCTKLHSPDPKPATVSAACKDAACYGTSVEDLLDNKHPHHAYSKAFYEARSESSMAIHGSGSTGFPKPLIYSLYT